MGVWELTTNVAALCSRAPPQRLDDVRHGSGGSGPVVPWHRRSGYQMSGQRCRTCHAYDNSSTARPPCAEDRRRRSTTSRHHQPRLLSLQPCAVVVRRSQRGLVNTDKPASPCEPLDVSSGSTRLDLVTPSRRPARHLVALVAARSDGQRRACAGVGPASLARSTGQARSAHKWGCASRARRRIRARYRS